MNFAIVAAGANAASPHHDAGDRGSSATARSCCCDFGGSLDGYCSDITRSVAIGDAVGRVRRRLRGAARSPGRRRCGGDASGTPAKRSTRSPVVIDGGRIRRAASSTAPATASVSRRTRTRTSSAATRGPRAGHAFSIEPGIYIAGEFGLRLEDIVVATADGPDAMNRVADQLVVVDA